MQTAWSCISLITARQWIRLRGSLRITCPSGYCPQAHGVSIRSLHTIAECCATSQRVPTRETSTNLDWRESVRLTQSNAGPERMPGVGITSSYSRSQTGWSWNVHSRATPPMCSGETGSKWCSTQKQKSAASIGIATRRLSIRAIGSTKCAGRYTTVVTDTSDRPYLLFEDPQPQKPLTPGAHASVFYSLL